MILDKIALLRQLSAPNAPEGADDVTHRLWSALHAAHPLIGIEPDDVEDLLAACPAPRVLARLASAGAPSGAQAAQLAMAALNGASDVNALGAAQALLLHLEGPATLGLHEASSAAEVVYAEIAEDTVVVFCASIAAEASQPVHVTLLTLSAAS